MLFGLKGALVTRFKAVERNIDEILVEQEVLTLFICEYNHKRLNQAVSQVNLHKLMVLRVDFFNRDCFKFIRISSREAFFSLLSNYLVDLWGVEYVNFPTCALGGHKSWRTFVNQEFLLDTSLKFARLFITCFLEYLALLWFWWLLLALLCSLLFFELNICWRLLNLWVLFLFIFTWCRGLFLW